MILWRTFDLGYEGDGTNCCIHSYYAAQIRLLVFELIPPLLKTLDDLQGCMRFCNINKLTTRVALVPEVSV